MASVRAVTRCTRQPPGSRHGGSSRAPRRRLLSSRGAPTGSGGKLELGLLDRGGPRPGRADSRCPSTRRRRERRGPHRAPGRLQITAGRRISSATYSDETVAAKNGFFFFLETGQVEHQVDQLAVAADARRAASARPGPLDSSGAPSIRGRSRGRHSSERRTKLVRDLLG